MYIISASFVPSVVDVSAGVLVLFVSHGISQIDDDEVKQLSVRTHTHTWLLLLLTAVECKR